MSYADVVKLHDRWVGREHYVPASEIRPEMMVKHIQSLRAKEREQEARIKRLEADIDNLKMKLRISTLP